MYKPRREPVRLRLHHGRFPETMQVVEGRSREPLRPSTTAPSSREPNDLFCRRSSRTVPRLITAENAKHVETRTSSDRCGVEVTIAHVAASTWATSNSPSPVAHIWSLKSMPSRLGLLLNMTARSLSTVICCENYMVVNRGETPARPKQLAHRCRVPPGPQRIR